MNKWINKNFIFLTILLLSVILRFWNLKELLIFTLDEELEAFIAKNIITGFHLPAIGISVAPVGIHLSPIFYYFVAIPFWIGGLDPVSWGIFASTVGVATTVVLYLTTLKMFTKRIATFATLFYASSFLMVLYDKHFWNVSFMPLISIIVLYSLFQILQKKYWWAIVLALALSMGISSHLSSMSLVILVIAVWVLKKLPIFKKQILIGMMIMIASQLPLIIFELRHDFYQTKALLKFFTGEHSGIVGSRIIENIMLLPKVFSRLIYTFGPHDFSREHTYGLVEIIARDSRIPVIMILAAVCLVAYFGFISYRNRHNNAYLLHGMLLLITIISLIGYGILFKGSLFEFYLSLVFPTLFIIMALFFDLLWSKGHRTKILATTIAIGIVTANIWGVLTSYNSYGLEKKLEVISWVKDQVGQSPYELHSIGVNHKYEGFRYLFERFYKAPVKSYVDPQLAWLYQDSVASGSPQMMVVLTSTEDSYKAEIEKEKVMYTPFRLNERQFREINAMIISTPLKSN